jgi:hypothetical protein
MCSDNNFDFSSVPSYDNSEVTPQITTFHNKDQPSKGSTLDEPRQVSIYFRSAAVSPAEIPFLPYASSDPLLDKEFCGMRNPGPFCPFICLLQAWFHIKGFRNVVFNSDFQDETLNQLKSLFRSLQNRQIGSRRTDCSSQVHFLEFGVWFMNPTHTITSELRF